ncbi:MAG: NAD(P)H-dependent oxidoreductase [Bacteroidota bacterium]
MKILKINASVKDIAQSVSRQMVEKFINSITTEHDQIVERDLSKGVSLISEDMVTAFYTPPADLSEEQKQLLSESDRYVQEWQEADTLVFGVPIYNFGVPGAMKAYFDLIARVGVTFKYSEEGPKGLLEGKKAYVVVASGGTGFRSEIDFASDYVKQFLTFLGITDIHFIDATQLMFGKEAALQRAEGTIAQLAEAAAGTA